MTRQTTNLYPYRSAQFVGRRKLYIATLNRPTTGRRLSEQRGTSESRFSQTQHLTVGGISESEAPIPTP